MKNALNWFELPALDFTRARKFYETLFNYSMPVIIDEENFKMGLLPADAEATGGAIVFNTGYYQPAGTAGPLIYLNANPDLSVVLQRVEPAGGKILIEKRQVSVQFGYMAIFTDSEGNRLALHSKS